VVFASELEALMAVGSELRIALALVALIFYYRMPEQRCVADGVQKLADVFLRWSGTSRSLRARLEMPRQLWWSGCRGETDPMLGRYSHGPGRRAYAFTLIGGDHAGPHAAFAMRIHFLDRHPKKMLLANMSGTDVPAMPSTNI
jgi:hypothetical protein